MCLEKLNVSGAFLTFASARNLLESLQGNPGYRRDPKLWKLASNGIKD